MKYASSSDQADRAAPLLCDLQRLLETVYSVEVGADVRDFLISDKDSADRLSPSCTHASETLLIVESGDVLDLALYLDDEVLGRLDENDPRECLDRDNFADFCTVLEGISHFNYVAHSAAKECAVTLMELELQAEVDKYIAARILAGGRRIGEGSSGRLMVRLFEAYRLGQWLDLEQRERYQAASRFAERYCASLERRFKSPVMCQAMFAELRTFYRQPQPGKVSHIAQVQLG